MRKVVSNLRRESLAIVAAAGLFAGCTDDALLSPDGQLVNDAQFAASAEETLLNSAARVPDLGVCQNLQAPADSKLAFRVYAEGVQIYRWNGTSWVFVAPEAELFADVGATGKVGIHYGGPTWESVSGSKVVGSVINRCTPDPASIQWLSLGVVSSEGPGIFGGVIFIQRLNTVGGLAPANSGTSVGELARIPYTTDYFFYRD